MEMYQNLRGAIAQGLNVAFLSGNTCWGRIELRPSSIGARDRTFGRVDYFGPRMRNGPEVSFDAFVSSSESARELPLGRQEQCAALHWRADWSCMLPEHWIYEGTGMSRGENPGLIGLGMAWGSRPNSGIGIVADRADPGRPRQAQWGNLRCDHLPGPERQFSSQRFDLLVGRWTR